MSEILYTEKEGGYWRPARFNLTIKEIEAQCLEQKKSGVACYNKVTITDENNSIKAAAIMFPDGSIWDAILSNYDTYKEDNPFNDILNNTEKVRLKFKPSGETL